jgi:[NiFe] hydrogenase assembly HybE family chaperone
VNVDTRIDTLAQAYRGIGEKKMKDLPIFNARLRVEAVDFRDWQGRMIGVMISPWFMNLVLLAAPDDDTQAFTQGASSDWDFPAGNYQFHGAEVAGIPHLTAALFSTVSDFPDQQSARSVAEAVLERLFDEDATQAPERSRKAVGDVLFEDRLSRRSLLRRVMLMPDQEG